MEKIPIINWLNKLQWWSKLSPENKLGTLLLVIAFAAVIWAVSNIDDRIRVYYDRAIKAETQLDECNKEGRLLEQEFRNYIKEDRQKTESIKQYVDSTIKTEVL